MSPDLDVHGQHAKDGYIAANEKMHRGMAIAFTGNADVDFVLGIIPQPPQGAVDMANVVIEHGSDPEIRELASEIIAAQETEIEFMREWLHRLAQ